MASLCSSSGSILGLHRPKSGAKLSPINVFSLRSSVLPKNSNFRPKVDVILQVRRRALAVFATNSNSSEGNSVTENSDVTKTSDDSSGLGPPLPTILAGFVVLFLVLWFVRSIAIWVYALVVSFLSSQI